MIALGSDVVMISIDDAFALLTECDRDTKRKGKLAECKRREKAGTFAAVEGLRDVLRLVHDRAMESDNARFFRP